MIEFLWNTVSFIVALGVLVTIHEYGHFWVARKLGVKVITFSVGFGKPLLQKTGKDGVQYILAAIPLGGYVKMLDERESEQPITKEELPFAFNQKSVWARMAIVLAGPVANFLLAIVLYWVIFIIGTEGLKPVVGTVPTESIAAIAGLKKQDVIVKVDNQTVKNRLDLVESIAKRLGDKDFLQLTVERKGFTQTKNLQLNLKNWHVDDEKPQILHSLGLFHPIENFTHQIGHIAEGKAASMAGIKVNDVIEMIDGVAVNNWQQLVDVIHPLANQSVIMQINRSGKKIELLVLIGSRQMQKRTIGYLGIGPKRINPAPYIVTQKAGFLSASLLAIETTYNKIQLTAKLFYKLIVGDISYKGISGPFSIAKGAGQSASYGLVAFLSFLAMISVNLGFINLLPVPVLDGGHLLFFVIEAIKGKPLSKKMQEFGLQIGMMLVFALMAIAFYNDIVIH